MTEERPGFQLAIRLGRIEVLLFILALIIKIAINPEWFTWWMTCMPLWVPVIGSILVAFYFSLRGKHNPFIPRDVEDVFPHDKHNSGSEN